MTNHKVTLVIIGLVTGLLFTSLFGLVMGPIWLVTEFPSLFLWGLLGSLIGASIGIIVYVRNDWIVNHPSSVIASVIFFGAIGLFLGRFLGARSVIRELWVVGGGLLSVGLGAVIGSRSRWLANHLISIFANAMFFGAIGILLGVLLGWNAAPEYKVMGAAAGGTAGGLLGLILGIIFGLILTPRNDGVPRRVRRIINGAIIGMGIGIVVSLVIRAIDSTLSFALSGYPLEYSWVQAIILSSSNAWFTGILPGGVTGAITVAVIEGLGSKYKWQDTGPTQTNVEQK